MPSAILAACKHLYGYLLPAIDAQSLSLSHLNHRSHQLKILSSGFAIRRGRTSFPESIITTLPGCVKGNY